jgi:hypothetical protein
MVVWEHPASASAARAVAAARESFLRMSTVIS